MVGPLGYCIKHQKSYWPGEFNFCKLISYAQDANCSQSLQKPSNDQPIGKWTAVITFVRYLHQGTYLIGIKTIEQVRERSKFYLIETNWMTHSQEK